MKEITFNQNTPQGQINGILRIKGKILYFKCNNNQYSVQMLSQLKAKGAEIIESRNWIRINLFSNQESEGINLVKIGDSEFDLKNTPEIEIEDYLTKFYVTQYTNAKFNTEWREIG